MRRAAVIGVLSGLGARAAPVATLIVDASTSPTKISENMRIMTKTRIYRAKKSYLRIYVENLLILVD